MTWGNRPGLGRWWKRQMHKARRRYWQEMIERGFWLGLGVDYSQWMYGDCEHYPPSRPHWQHPRRGLCYEREVNWQCW